MGKKRTICFYCLDDEKCTEFCMYKKFKPTAEVMANFPNGSTAKWKHGWIFTRHLVYLRDKRKCHFCECMIIGKHYETHHLKRRQFKGSNHPRNLANCCPKCHQITLASYTEKILVEQKIVKKNKAYWSNLLTKKVS